MQYVCGRMSRAALYKEPGSRLPAAAPCLERHAHPAGRSPNSSSLFLPLAAVVAVAQGLFPRRTVRRVDAVRIHPCIPFFKADKTETPVPGLDTGVLGGRGWIARAALLKTAHWAVFALSSATAPQLFESTLAAPFSRQIKQKLRYPLDTGVLGGRGWIARAALLKTAHWAVFALSSATAPQLFESTLAAPFSRQIKQKLRYPLDTGVLGGRGWIRTTEAESSRFTVCPHWPLGNTPIFSCCASVRRTTCLF